jgi:tetratricopeptide (TPR) repeat protein
MILLSEQKLPEALSAYREAVRLDPDSVDAHNGLAMTLANSVKLVEAVAEFREIVRIDPDSTIGYYNLSHVLAGLDRDVEAAAALREVIRIYPATQCALQPGRLFGLEANARCRRSSANICAWLRTHPIAAPSRAPQAGQQFEDPDTSPCQPR